MNDTSNKAISQSLGEELRQARERAGLSVEKVAKDLFLDIQKIRYIETNNFKDLGAPVYAKGYLKKYARLVGLGEDDVLQRYAVHSDAPGVPIPVPASMGSIPESRRPLPGWVLWVVMGLIALAGLATLFNMHTPETVAVQHGKVILQPLHPPGSVVSAPVVGPASSSTTAASLSLSFKFNGDSWVEVYDADNRQILYDMGTADTARAVTGTPPLRVVLGAATAVTLQVNAQPVTVPATHIEAGVARFVLNRNGALE